MATDFKKALDKLVKASGGDWRVFIRQLGPLHAQWHAEHNAGQATLGFLLFHWELIQRFRAVGADQGLGGLNGIQPYTEPQLANFGAAYTVLDPSARAVPASWRISQEILKPGTTTRTCRSAWRQAIIS